MRLSPFDSKRFAIRGTQLEDPRFHRSVAVDRLYGVEVTLERVGPALRDRLAGQSLDRLLREVRAIAPVDHPRVVRLREALEDEDGMPVLVLESRPGERLDEMLAREARLAPQAAVRIAVDVAEAAGALHHAGVVHRGIAAHNVLVDAEGRASLTGFGFAKPIDPAGPVSSLMHAHSLDEGPAELGLPEYAAPEQIDGHPADHRADVFALGCLLYRMLVGVEAFPENAMGFEPPEQPRRVVPGVPSALSELVMRCLARVVTSRPNNMPEVVRALQTSDPSEGAGRPAGRSRLIAVAAFVVVAALAAWGTLELSASGPRYATGFDRAHAVVIGCDYRGSPVDEPELVHAENDARAIADVLRRRGFHVTLLLGRAATGDAIREQILRVRDDMSADDQVVVFVAMHGEGRTGASSDIVDLVPFNGAPNVQGVLLRDMLQQTRAKHALLLLDFCHAGALTGERGIPVEEPVTDEELDRWISRPAKCVIASARAHERSKDDSPFHSGLMKALAILDEPVTLSHLVHHVTDAYEATDGLRQSWVMSDYVPGTFVFASDRIRSRFEIDDD